MHTDRCGNGVCTTPQWVLYQSFWNFAGVFVNMLICMLFGYIPQANSSFDL